MSPFAGEGADLAVHGGARLASAVVEHPGDVEAALGAYEAESFPRSAIAAADSAQSLELVFADGALRQLVELFAALDEQRAPTRGGTVRHS